MNKLIVLLLVPFLIFAQEHKFESQALVDDFIKAYNNEDYHSVFELFSL